MSVENNISKRALDTLALKSPLNGLMFEVMPKIHHPEFNPSGALNLGLAHNDLLAEKVFEKVSFTCSSRVKLVFIFYNI